MGQWGWYSSDQSSDFAIAEVVVWDQGLTYEEIYEASEYLAEKFAIEVSVFSGASLFILF